MKLPSFDERISIPFLCWWLIDFEVCEYAISRRLSLNEGTLRASRGNYFGISLNDVNVLMEIIIIFIRLRRHSSHTCVYAYVDWSEGVVRSHESSLHHERWLNFVFAFIHGKLSLQSPWMFSRHRHMQQVLNSRWAKNFSKLRGESNQKTFQIGLVSLARTFIKNWWVGVWLLG